MDTIILVEITLGIVGVVAIIVVLNVLQNRQNKHLKEVLTNLEIEKNRIDSTPIIPELAKVEAFKNEKLDVMYEDWKERFEHLKNDDIPRITDMIIEADYSLSQTDYKSALYKVAKLEMEIYKVRTTAQFLLNEIRDLTSSEERNRALITKLKATYRDLYQQFKDNKEEYGDVTKSVSLQFENIARRFEDFEELMENKDYVEVDQLVKAIDEMLKHMKIVVEEVPSIVLMATSVLPLKIKEVEETYNKMVQMGYPLDYLNVEYNVTEANKKIDDVLARTMVLNLEDCVFELKVLADYFDSLFEDFDKEKRNRNTYEEVNKGFKKKLDKMNKIVSEIFKQIDDIKNVYNLSSEDVELLNQVHAELDTLNGDYKVLMDHTSNNTFAYSKLTKEVEALSVRLGNTEAKLDACLDTIGNMHDDELRARQQLTEIRTLLKDAKNQIREYNLPIIPKFYYTELDEAQLAIKEIIKELDKKPITIEVLNTRVDTARDLVLKLFGKTKEMMKTARFAEMALVYGNRFRSTEEELNKKLNYAESLFYKGEYQKSLELTINSLNVIEPGIYDKLQNLYDEGH